MSTPSFNGLLVISVIAVMAPILAATVKRLKLPSAVVEIAAGVITGPSVLGWVKIDEPINVVALLGLAFLLFLAGLEVDLRATTPSQLPRICQCCAQGKDAARAPGRQRCCAIGACCYRYPGRRTVQAARDTLRAALSHAQTSDHLVPRNVTAFATVPSPRRRRREGSAWTAAQARRPAVRRVRPGPGLRSAKPKSSG